MIFERAEKYRCPHPLGLLHRKGDPFGTFAVPTTATGPKLFVLASCEGGWDHLSVSTFKRVPTWEEMCKVKDLFFAPEDVVVQYHPRASEYVNFATNCLHLWRPRDEVLPVPPMWMVGPK